MESPDKPSEPSFNSAAERSNETPRKIRISDTFTKDIHKALFSSPSQFYGMYEDENILVTHAFPALADRTSSIHRHPGPWRRSHFMFAFKAAADVSIGERKLFADCSHFVNQFIACLAVFFGKQFDGHGVIESSGFFQAPIVGNTVPVTWPTLSPYHSSSRIDLDIPLNFTKIAPLLRIFEPSVDSKLRDAFFTGSSIYLRALRAFHTNPEGAYIDLVLCGEVISQYQNLDGEDLYDNDLRATLSRLTELGATEADLRLIKSRLYQVKRRYTRSITKLLNEQFFGRTESQIDELRLRPDSIDKALSASYDLRSRYVHRGTPLHGFLLPTVNNNELATGVPAVEDKQLQQTFWRALTFVGMERVIRFCLLRLIHTNGVHLHPDLD